MKRGVCAALVAALAGCGTGGGSGSGGPGGARAVAPAAPAVVPAAGGGDSTPPSSFVPYPTLATVNSNNGGDVRVFTAIMSQDPSSIPTPGQVVARADGAGNFTFTVNAHPGVASYQFTVGLANGGPFSVAGTGCGECFRNGSQTGLNTDAISGSFTFLDPGVVGLSYMTVGSWGVWNNSNGLQSGGAGVFGVPTRSADLPKTGTATYAGHFIGTYRNGQIFDSIGATASATANFGTGMVSIETNNSQRSYIPLGETTNAMPLLDFAGTMTFQSSGGARTNQLQGPVATRGGWGGEARGSFYGPAAAELGGSVLFKPAGAVPNNVAFIGAFGMKKQ
jgi:transferrin binding protein